ncbi:hypothetical protein EJ07DRAFT_181761 [Lizonia empirigonia]|nr:hypothetical protein EJ07DRAFT_181761 [Lizonia empirigonia]
MAAYTTPATSANTVEGDQEITIKICDISTAGALAQQVFELGEQAARITSIHVDTTSYFRALEEAEDLAYLAEKNLKVSDQSKDTTVSSPSDLITVNTPVDPSSIAASLCAPIITILAAITSHSGSLTSFTWPASSHTHCKFTRPLAFWSALYAHILTLEKLHLDFFCHEVHDFPPPPAGVMLERLKALTIDASSAHGDDGSAIDDLLARCKNVEVLTVEWPPCDLDSCQIKGISWGWSFPKLEYLRVSSWNFHPAAYTDFLVRHPGIISLEERVDGPYDESGQAYADVNLPATALPNLGKLKKAYTNTHSLASYFDTAANRPIRTLTLCVGGHPGVEQGLMEITDPTPAQTHLRTLEFMGDIKCWRDEETNNDSSDDEDETAQERQQRKETENQDRLSRLPTRLPTILKTALPAFSTLAKLTIEMDSSIETLDPSTGTYTSPPPMNESDLLALLALLLPSTNCKLRLLRLRDSWALPLGALVEKRLVTG